MYGDLFLVLYPEAFQLSSDDVVVEFHAYSVIVAVPDSMQEWDSGPLSDFIAHHDSV